METTSVIMEELDTESSKNLIQGIKAFKSTYT